MKRPIIYPYKMGSRSARNLSEALRSDGLRSKRVRGSGNYQPFRNHLVINWGSASRPHWLDSTVSVLNKPESVEGSSNKVVTFKALNGRVPIPPYTQEREVALQWLSEGHSVVVRHLTRANSGRGIEIVESGGELPRAPLYTQYIKKRDEYRVHVFRDKVIDVQQKKRNLEDEAPNYQVRNHGNGWVFCREGVELPDGVSEDCIKAVEILGLDFGAVDVIWNAYYEKHYLLEINTAPNLEGITLETYTNTFKEVCHAY